MTKLLNTLSILGCGSAIAVAGIGLKNPTMVTVGLNAGVSGAAITSFINKSEQQQQRDRQYFNYLDELKVEILTLTKYTQQQQGQLDLIREDRNKATQQQIKLWEQIEFLNKNNIEQQENLATVREQSKQAIAQQQEFDLKLNRTQLQLNKHNKKIKQQQHDLKCQKTNQNKINGELQKTKNQQQKIADATNKRDVQIVKQIDVLLDIAKTKPHYSNEISKKKSSVLAIKPIDRVYIDNNNLYNCAKELGIKIDYQALMNELTLAMGKTIIKLYDGAFPNQKYKYIPLKKMGYQVFTLPISKRGKDKFKTVGDDVKLSIDLVEDVREGDRITLVAGDGDYIPAIEKIKQQNAKVTVIASRNAISRDLVAIADKVIYLDNIIDRIAKHTKLSA